MFARSSRLLCGRYKSLSHPKERTEVQLLTITTDPEIDSPKVLRAYAKRYGAEFENWAFLTGDPAVLAQVWKNFGVGVKRRARGLIDHTPLTAIVDQSKAMRFAYIGLSPDQHAVLGDVRSLLKGIRVLIDPCDATGSAQNGSCVAFST